jgi:hypothetical protein
LAGRLEHAERDRIAHRDGERAAFVGHGVQCLRVLEQAEEIGMLIDHRRDVVTQRRAECVHRAATVAVGTRRHVVLEIGAQHFEVMRMERTGDHVARAPGLAARQ